jgi:hypothetical protein
MAQKKRSLPGFQLPEPWVGQIDVSPIPFVCGAADPSGEEGGDAAR